jgi:hypothetical protein
MYRNPIVNMRTWKTLLLLQFVLPRASAFVSQQMSSYRTDRIQQNKKTGAVSSVRPSERRSSKVPLQQTEKGEVDWMKSVFINNKNKAASSRSEIKVMDGYSDTLKNRLYSHQAGRDTPGKRLMDRYQSKSTKKVPPPPAPMQNPNETVFDKIKGTFWSGVDSAYGLTQKKTPEAKELISKPVIKARLSAAQEISASIQRLQSSNPIERAIAEREIRNWERKERLRQEALEREGKIQKIKENVYQVGDTVKWFAGGMLSIPNKVADAVDKTGTFAKTIPDAVKTSIDTVASIPDKMTEAARNVQTSVDNTMASTAKAIDDVKALPKKIDTTAKQTKQTVNELATSSKVLLGLEKPKPKPPKIPPPKPSTNLNPDSIGWTVVETVASFTGKAIWIVGKGILTLTWKLGEAFVSKGFEAVQQQIKERSAVMDEQNQPKKAVWPKQSISKQPSSTLPNEQISPAFDAELSEEVASALKVAREALGTGEGTLKAQSGINTSTDGAKSASWDQPKMGLPQTQKNEIMSNTDQPMSKFTDASKVAAEKAKLSAELEKEVADALKMADDAINLSSSVTKKNDQ